VPTEHLAAGTGEDEGVAHLAIGVAAEERAAKPNTLFTSDPREHGRRSPVRRKRCVSKLGNEGNARGEELGQCHQLSSRGGRLSHQSLRLGQVPLDVSQRHLELHRRNAHGADRNASRRGEGNRPASPRPVQARGSTRIGSPPSGESVGIWRTVMVRPGRASRRNRCRSIVATSFTSVWPKRLPMQILWPPPKGT